jgi:hypothetical protein
LLGFAMMSLALFIVGLSKLYVVTRNQSAPRRAIPAPSVTAAAIVALPAREVAALLAREPSERFAVLREPPPLTRDLKDALAKPPALP